MYIEHSASPRRRLDIKDLIHHVDIPCGKADYPQPISHIYNQMELPRDSHIHIEVRYESPLAQISPKVRKIARTQNRVQKKNFFDALAIRIPRYEDSSIAPSPTGSWDSSSSGSQTSFEFPTVDSIPPRRAPRSNVQYTDEETDFIRYHRMDKGMPWGPKTCQKTGRILSHMLLMFRRRFKNSRVTSPDGLHSKFYRENQFFLMFDENDSVVLKDGAPLWATRKMREKKGDGQKEAKELKYTHPEHTLVEMYPHRALTYEWVSAEDKAAIIKSLECPRARKRYEQKIIWSKKTPTTRE